MRKVVCAAMKMRFGLIICGARHFDAIVHSQIKALGLNHTDVEEQGFIDQYGVYMTREEAYVVATTAKQIIRRVGGDEGRLYSENLY